MASLLNKIARVEIPGQACPGFILNSALGAKLKVELPKDFWFTLDLKGKSADSIDFESNILYWSGEKISEAYNKHILTFFQYNRTSTDSSRSRYNHSV
ncbi:hypothetical protein C9J12_22280 [Photobacterium frigidiphilum]|uniref:Uncharacterized protein n=2 Tax=Photobacterium frigidiphilum TaxID=264736 RepID=A0A2T3J9E6_9GAMM|nr:hypothetical protein C9J12_22280 [Photobacterium frigidiphilum]